MRIGIIDLGTNSVRFDVHQVNKNGEDLLLHREKLMIRLGQGVFLKGRLDPSAIRRAIQAFRSFHQTAKLLQAQKVIAFGTSALREASDAEAFVALIHKRTGIEIRIISGDEEAQLIAAGVLSNEKSLKGRFGLVDIGGGSTEISITQEKEILHSASFPLGVARLQQIFLKTVPPQKKRNEDPILNLRRYAKSIILPRFISEEWPKVPTLVGSSGTIRALERLLKRNNGGDTDRKGLRKLVKEMSGLTKAELLTIPGMEIKRVDLILSGAILLEECMDALGANSFTTTGYSLRDGILEREMRLMRRQGKGQTYFNLDDLFRKARRLGSNVGHLKQVCHLAESLFDATKRLHRLDPIWKRYLSAAAILHDVGEAISPIHHEMHSYYVVRHGDFLSMENWESEFIARLCLHHNGTPGTLNKKDLNFTEEKAKKLAFVKLLALLRVADGLDRGHQSSLKIKSVRIEKQKISLTLSGGGPIDLDILRAEQKKALFEETFRRELVIHKSG